MSQPDLHSPAVRFTQPRPHIVLTNDDGIHSRGLMALKAAIEPVGDVTVVAPDGERSGAARSITMHAPLWVEDVPLADGGRGYATDGTPVDCTRMAALGLLERAPDLILSGINLGGNLGDDITYSGTVAAALEGIMLDIPAIAISAAGYHQDYDLSVPARVARLIVEQALTAGLPAATLLNVNCPDRSWDGLAGIRLTRLGKRVYGDRVRLQESQGRRHRCYIYSDDIGYREEEGTDFAAIAEGVVSITPLHFDLMSHAAFDQLRSWDRALAEKIR